VELVLELGRAGVELVWSWSERWRRAELVWSWCGEQLSGLVSGWSRAELVWRAAVAFVYRSDGIAPVLVC